MNTTPETEAQITALATAWEESEAAIPELRDWDYQLRATALRNYLYCNGFEIRKMETETTP